tara:strand:+ start:168 stop:542 length:375 start_codon:yes stop_codon:yes gene_type:complete
MRAGNPVLVPDMILELTAESPPNLIIDASRHLDKLAIEYPAFEPLILAIAEYLNAISHEKHALERLRLCELITETTSNGTRSEYAAKLPELRLDAAHSSEASDIARNKVLYSARDLQEAPDPIR